MNPLNRWMLGPIWKSPIIRLNGLRHSEYRIFKDICPTKMILILDLSPILFFRFYFSHIATTYDMQITTQCWSLCKSDDENILALSMDLKKGNSNQGILKYTVQSNNIIQLIWICWISFLLLLGFSKQGLVPYEPIDLSKLFAKHALYAPMQLGVVEMMVDSYYQLNTDTPDATVTLQVSKVTNGLVKQFANEAPSKMILHQSIKINNFTSIIFKFWRQICIIDTIKESVVNFKETKDPSTLIFNITSEGYFKWANL